MELKVISDDNISPLQEVSQIHLGLDLDLQQLLHPPPLPLCPSLPVSLPPPPLSNRGGGLALVGVSPPSDPAGGRDGDMLRADCPGNPELCLPGTSAAAAAAA